MSDSDLMQLYSGRILALAADIPNLGTLPQPQGQAQARAPLCGSTVSAMVVMEGGRVKDFAQEVRACALGQAAAAVVGQALPGRTRAEVAQARDDLAAMLAGGPAPRGAFADFEALVPARAFKNRHASIQLALQAALQAIEAAEA